ncbi:MAG: N-acetyltransferase [Pseudomonadales bacterium]
MVGPGAQVLAGSTAFPQTKSTLPVKAEIISSLAIVTRKMKSNKQHMLSVRFTTNLDSDNICQLYSRTFPDSESESVAMLASNLLHEITCPETFALVAEQDNAVAGHIAFSPVTVERNESLRCYILAPLAVMPAWQRTGIGSRLIERGIEELAKKNTDLLFVYGDPKYYGKFGFSAQAAANYSPPYKLAHPFGWQAIALRRLGVSEQAGNIRCVVSLRDPRLW